MTALTLPSAGTSLARDGHEADRGENARQGEQDRDADRDQAPEHEQQHGDRDRDRALAGQLELISEHLSSPLSELTPAWPTKKPGAASRPCRSRGESASMLSWARSASPSSPTDHRRVAVVADQGRVRAV
jgi:hypothetical protein